MSFEDKVVIVTGAARGIGRACAERFAQEGASVVLADIDEDGGEKVEAELTEAGHAARFIGCDIAEKLDIRNLIAATLEAHSQIDVLVNNAAILDSAPFLELEEDTFDRVLRVNLKGTFLMGQSVARQMAAQVDDGGPPGAIVNMSSVNAVFALPDHVAYTISKGGIAQLTKVMALSLADRGIRVNAIGPGSINTQMLEQVADDKETTARIMSRTPVGRFGETSEIAAIAVFLASPEASYITGTTVYADGGRLALNYVVDPPNRS